jgi:hypothetical protein
MPLSLAGGTSMSRQRSGTPAARHVALPDVQRA